MHFPKVWTRICGAALVTLLVGATAPWCNAYTSYQVTVTVMDGSGNAENDSWVRFHNLSTNSSSLWRYTGLNDNEYTFTRTGCSKYDSVRVEAVKDTLMNQNTKKGDVRYVICDSIEAETVRVYSAIVIAYPYAYAEPAPAYGARSVISTRIQLATDVEDSVQFAERMRYSAHFSPGSLQVLSITPEYGSGFYETEVTINNSEGYMSYECESYNPAGEPVPGPGQAALTVAYVEVDAIATLDPCSPFILHPYNPEEWPYGRQVPPSSVNGQLCLPTETHFPFFTGTGAAESSLPRELPVELKPLSGVPSIDRPSVELTLAFAFPRVSLSVIDATGRIVSKVFEGSLGRGKHVYTWDGRGADGYRAPRGVYFWQIRAGQHIATKQFVLAGK